MLQSSILSSAAAASCAQQSATGAAILHNSNPSNNNNVRLSSFPSAPGRESMHQAAAAAVAAQAAAVAAANLSSTSSSLLPPHFPHGPHGNPQFSGPSHPELMGGHMPPPHHHHHHPHHHPPHPSHMGPHGPHGPHGHPGLMELPKPRLLFRVPRVVPNQKEKYESDELMKRHSREGEVRYTAFRDRPLHERQSKFIQSIREGILEIAFIATGFNLMLSFDTFTHAFHPERRQIDFEKEPGKVHIRSPFIFNGVCVRWKGYLDIERLDGVGCIEFDEETAKVEDIVLKDQVEAYNRRMKDFEEHRKQQQRQIAAFMEQQQHALAALNSAAVAASSPVSASVSSTVTSASSNGENFLPVSSTTNHGTPSPEKSSSTISDVDDEKCQSPDIIRVKKRARGLSSTITSSQMKLPEMTT